MLISFEASNLYSFRDKVVLDMKASKIKAHRLSLIKNERHDILPVAAVYGANAAGKTNLLRAFDTAFAYLSGRKNEGAIPFIMGDELNKQIPSYEINFALNVDGEVIECKFSFSVLSNTFFNERLHCIEPGKKSHTLIYSRDWDEENGKWILKCGLTKFSKQFAKEIKYVDGMEKSQGRLLITALGMREQFPLFLRILEWSSKTSLYNEVETHKIGAPVLNKESFITTFINDSKNLVALESFMRIVNPMINGVSLVNVKREEEFPHEGLLPVFDYDCAFTKSKDTGLNQRFIISALESKGVWTALNVFPRIQRVLSEGGVLIVDELENCFHPLLMAKVISLFTMPENNPGQGQLIFTTHNALIMDKKRFRQDEIVFVEKDSKGVSSLYRLSDIEGVRSDLDFCKNYIMGAFGAVPNITDMTEEA